MSKISEKDRKIGINILGDIPWGAHLCQFYQTREDLIEILVPYFKAGLENDEFCIWATSEPLPAEDAMISLKKAVKNLDNYIIKGQIEILEASQCYTKLGKFKADKALKGWVEKEREAIKKGFDGLRLAENTFWLKKRNWKSFANYEAELNNIIGQYKMLAICSYSLDKCRASELIEVASNHPFILIKKEGKWEIIECPGYKRVQELLKKSEQHCSQLFDAVADAIILFSAQGRFLDCNKATLQLLGYSREEFLRLRPDDIVHPEFHLLMKDNQKRIWAGEVTIVELAHRCQDGRIIPVEVNARRIEYKGKPAILAVVRDITDRKQREEEKDRLQIQLIQAEKMAGIGIMASGIAHEFNNLLQIITGHAEFAKKTKKAKDMEEALDIVINTSGKAAKIIEDLLSFSREEGTEKELCDITDVVESVLSLIEEHLEKHNIKVVRRYKKTHQIEVNKAEMGEVFLNIITNARDAMFPESGKLKIRVKRVKENVEINFTDTGKGIKMENLGKVFEPFYTTKKATGEDSELQGAGLGLSVSYGIVKRHGGTIEVESKKGQGTTFTVKLPVNEGRTKKRQPKA